jgi:predicted RNA-binding Zn ribbon-like protein
VKTTSGKSGSEWKGGFLFLGNQFALDFLNTRPVQDGQTVELLPDFAALVRWFEAAGLLNCRNAAAMRQRWAETGRARRTLEAVLDLRERLRSEVVAWESGAEIRGSMIDELNRLMEEHPALTKIKALGDTLARELWFRMEEPEDLLGPIVYNAATLFTEVDRERVRKCGQCVLHFQDTSKKGTRRWCSMQLCGNRLKVATYAARRRAR